MIRNIILFIIFGLFISSISTAETIEIKCPRIEVGNPYNIEKITDGAGWEVTTAAKSILNCRNYIDPQGYLRCSYKASAHSSVNTYAMKRMPPENTTCEAKDPECSFNCTRDMQKTSIKLKAPVKKLMK